MHEKPSVRNEIDPSSRWVHRDLKSALLLIAIGGGVAWSATDYEIGELTRLGPGYLPFALGVILIGLGVLLLVTPALSSVEEREQPVHDPFDLRAWSCIIGGVVSFMLLGRYGGLVPATFTLVFLSAMGDRGNTIRGAVLLAAVMTFTAVVLFSMVLGIQFPLLVLGR